MGKRLLTSAVGIVVFFAVMLTHQYVLYSAVTVLVLGMLYEMYKVMCVGRFLRGVGYLSALLVCGGFAIGKQIVVITAVLVIFIAAMVAMHGKVTSKKVLSVGFVTLAIAVLMSMLMLMRKNCGRYVTILPFVCAWLTDTGAYTVGSLWGKRKLAEKISPNKTVEGAIGGLLFSAVGSALFVTVCVLTKVATVSQKSNFTVVVLLFALLGLLSSVVSQFGDLAASCIKRDFEKKDYGNILPGHGGLLDRFDSVLLLIPFIYYVMRHFL